ncbi:hypothetical protein ACFYO2_43965 [Streptomyces sp. NPDC006602]|uniref:hypothetical protein n=1 Tax=Streptomyces sp. NPDC006602 TaxID=3364751 RepID=UPI0036775A37
MSVLPLNLAALDAELGRDPEFVLHARHLTTAIRVLIGQTQSFRIVIRDGALIETDPVVTPFDSYDIQLAGSEEQWEALLSPVPPAFYQDFYPAMLHHGFRVEGDMETIMAYYPVIRRLAEILRAVTNAGASA